jgi:hypothetical protein
MTLRYGYDLKDWEAAKDDIVKLLSARVRAGSGPITYGDLCSTMKSIVIEPHSYALAHLLGAVSDDEDAAGRGMLSAYVVSVDTRVPGGGFFELAEKLARDVRDRDAFWISELRRVEAAWMAKP